MVVTAGVNQHDVGAVLHLVSALGPEGAYQMEHSANVMLINPRGDYHGFFRAPLDIPKMRVTLRSTQYVWEH